MAKNTRKCTKSEERDANETIQKLKAQVRNLKKQNRELKSENKTLLDVWAKSEAFVSEITEDIPLEEIVKQNKLPKMLTKEDEKEQARKKWAKWRQENL